MKVLYIILTEGVLVISLMALEPVNLIRNGNFDHNLIEWDTLSYSTTNCPNNFSFGFPDSSQSYSSPFSLSMDSRKDGTFRPTSAYQGNAYQSLLIPKKIKDIVKLKWCHKVKFKQEGRDRVSNYSVRIITYPFILVWRYTNEDVEDHDMYRIFKLEVPHSETWGCEERDIREDAEYKGIDLNTWIIKLDLENKWVCKNNEGYGQKVYWDDIKLVGWADYDRALTRIVSGVPEKGKPYRAQVMLWNNGREKVDVSDIEMLLIKDGVDTVYHERLREREVESDDSVKVSFSEWIPEEDGNYRMEFYTGYLWGKYFGDELVVDECDENDYLVMEFTLGVEEGTDEEGVIRWVRQSSKYIEFEIGVTGYADIGIYDIHGRKVVGIYSGYVRRGERINYEWADLSCGTYFINVDMGGSSVMKKVVKIR